VFGPKDEDQRALGLAVGTSARPAIGLGDGSVLADAEGIGAWALESIAKLLFDGYGTS
jgi:hypothetical protein